MVAPMAIASLGMPRPRMTLHPAQIVGTRLFHFSMPAAPSLPCGKDHADRIPARIEPAELTAHPPKGGGG